jgi:hypothetical protein
MEQLYRWTRAFEDQPTLGRTPLYEGVRARILLALVFMERMTGFAELTRTVAES